MNKQIRLAALFMAFLVVTLPVAFAQQLDVTRFSGTDDVEGIISPANDTLAIDVTAEMRGEPSSDIARTRLRVLHGAEDEYFDSCASKGASLYDCSYVSDDLISSGTEEYNIVLVDAEGSELKSVKKTLMVDASPPEIIEFSVEPTLSRTGNMKIEFVAEDYGRYSGDSSACSGLKQIQLTVNSNIIKTFDFAQNECESGKQVIDYEYVTSDKYADFDVCIAAMDYLGQKSSPVCEEFRIDNSPPSIQSVEFRDDKGYKLSHVKTGLQVNADMRVTIKGEDDVVFDSVKADLSKLNPSIKEKSPDDIVDDTYIWESVAITTPGTCEVTVSARDEIGNEATTILPCTLPVDDAGPSPTVIYASAIDSNGTPLVGVNGSIFVDFDEDGSGMDKAKAYLDLHNLGLGTVVQADKCTEQAGQWTCEWKVVPKVSTGTYKITLVDGTSDDLGNFIGAQMSEDIVVDTSAPEIHSVDVTFIHENADFGPNAVYGDTIEFLFNTTDAVEGYVNLSMINGNYTPAVSCTGDTCKFVVYIDASGPLNTTLNFDFYDIARNHEVYDYNFMVYGVLVNDTTTNYWTSKVTCSPKMIDRHTAEFFNHPVYCHVKLKPSNLDAEIAYVEPGDFGTCLGNFSGYVVDMEVLNNNYGSKDPYVVFTLAAAPFTINELKFTCPIFISTRIGEFFSPVVEVENVSVDMEFYNLPYGEVYDNYENDIKDAMKNALNTMSWIDDVEMVFEYARKLCNGKQTLTNVLTVFEAAIELLIALGAFIGSLLTIVGERDLAEQLVRQSKFLCNKGSSWIAELLSESSTKSKEKSEDAKNEDKKPAAGKKELGFGDYWNLLDLVCKAANCQLSREDAEKYEKAGHEKTATLIVASSAIFGEGIPGVCKWWKEFVGGGTAIDLDKMTKDYDTGATKSPIDTKESIISSVACTCIPGISYNLKKMRNIYCGYAYCLGKRVLEEGLPRSYCDSEKAYLTCNYVVGQVFEIFPFATLVDKYSRIIQEVYANPISAFTVLSALFCGGNEGRGGLYDYCAPRNNLELDTADMVGYLLCSLPKTAAKVGDAVASAQLIGTSDYWLPEVSDSYCEDAEELLE